LILLGGARKACVVEDHQFRNREECEKPGAAVKENVGEEETCLAASSSSSAGRLFRSTSRIRFPWHILTSCPSAMRTALGVLGLATSPMGPENSVLVIVHPLLLE